MMNLSDVVKGVVLSKVCSVKADKDSTISKNINLEVTFDGVPLQAVFDKALSSTVIQWQNGPGRSKFGEWTNGQTVKINFSAPAKTTVDPIDALLALAKAAGVTPEEYLRMKLESK